MIYFAIPQLSFTTFPILYEIFILTTLVQFETLIASTSLT